MFFPRSITTVNQVIVLEKWPFLLISCTTKTGRRRHPAKCAKQNITGPRNQSRPQNLSPESGSENSSDGDYSDSEVLDITELDSFAYLEVDTDHDSNNNEADWEEVAQADFQDRLFALIAQIEEDKRDAGDNDWMHTMQNEQSRDANLKVHSIICYVSGNTHNPKSGRLNDESVQTSSLAWLTVQAAGTVTPKKFREGVNKEILPALGISPKAPISKRTARQWLVRLAEH
ncbi:hypothetical protein C8F04DRAFT_1192105 [Mycena alexandri]|uniref:Uncharacterized protein n=1 Tax=Mycena alexandri TaxID=1745969 RepID=A0AAD6SCP1_9AGAR|nr:hypothetical protein C8F04DRAFT_1192105 [Mycena alexandri]